MLNVFSCTYLLFIIFFGKVHIHIFCPFKKFWLSSLLSFDIFCQFVAGFFSLLTVAFHRSF